MRSWSKRRDQKIEHRVPHLAMIRAKLKIPEIAIHIFLADVNMRAGNRCFEQMPEAFEAVDVMARAAHAIGPNPLLAAMIYGGVRIAIAAE